MFDKRELVGVALAILAFLVFAAVAIATPYRADKRERKACESSGGTYQQIGRQRSMGVPSMGVVYGCVKE